MSTCHADAGGAAREHGLLGRGLQVSDEFRCTHVYLEVADLHLPTKQVLYILFGSAGGSGRAAISGFGEGGANLTRIAPMCWANASRFPPGNEIPNKDILEGHPLAASP